MKLSGVAVALVLAAAPIAAQQPQTTPSPSSSPPSTAASPSQRDAGASTSGGTITLQGCVKPGVDKDSVVMTNVTEVASGGRSAMPTEAHGRKVIFWLDRDEALKPHTGHMVRVTGTPGAIEKSEVELKPGHQKEGGLVAEFEGPGKDVKASNADVGQALGTSGRTSADKDDVKTFLLRVKVDNVTAAPGTCQ